MREQATRTDMTAVSQWIIEPYGTPIGQCEASRVPGFYKAEALAVFAPVRGSDAATLERAA